MSCDNGWFPSSTHAISQHRDNQPQSAEISPALCNNMMSTGLDLLETAETDCTKAALAIVEQLEKMSNGRHSAVPTCGLTATEACQRLLTILMCPCSEQADVALLVASGCISLMDMVYRSARAESDRGSGSLDMSSSSSSSDGPSIISHGSCEPDLLLWSRPQPSSSRSLARDGQSQVGDLSKVAKVILQFTDRYGQDTTKGGARWEHTTWVVAPVTALLRCRLQSVTHGVARHMVF
ncbi:hypothetical protein BDV26DRAFT_275281 [Aspergillus bertholletiae]|uniref:Aflatoxin regulatory protein domain-containing protein n=1 Tax=Aspergillus bertholletiae TaxID=1226010 RepID=A0A5N7AS45_9EURO|nr:hypothetical protein BDV26DRAFT_275281 [Aspergillus bertholletiae]